MTVYNVKIYGGEAELVGKAEKAVGDEVGFSFPRATEGCLEIGRVTRRLENCRAVFKPGDFPIGSVIPTLTANGVRIALPRFIRDSEGLAPAPLTDGDVRKISERERELCKRVTELEKTVERILAKIETKIKF